MVPLATPATMESQVILEHLATLDHLVTPAPVALLARRVRLVHPAGPARMVFLACQGQWAQWAPVAPQYPNGSLLGSVVRRANLVFLALMARQDQTASLANLGLLGTTVFRVIMVFRVPLVCVDPLGIMGCLAHLVLRVQTAGQVHAVDRVLRARWATTAHQDTPERLARWDSLGPWDHRATTVSRARRAPLVPPVLMVHRASTARRVTPDVLAQLVHPVPRAGLASAVSQVQRDQLALLAAPATRLFGCVDSKIFRQQRTKLLQSGH